MLVGVGRVERVMGDGGKWESGLTKLSAPVADPAFPYRVQRS